MFLDFNISNLTPLINNLIFNELLTRGYSVDTGIINTITRNKNGNNIRKQNEIHFVASIEDKKYYIQQITSVYDGEKINQFVKSFIKIKDSFKKVIIVRESISPRRDENGIIIISLKDFLLNENILKEY